MFMKLECGDIDDIQYVFPEGTYWGQLRCQVRIGHICGVDLDHQIVYEHTQLLVSLCVQGQIQQCVRL